MDLIKSIRVFVRSVDAGSMAAAARAMELSPAVVTRLLGDLEDSLGVRLLHRTSRRLTLTNIGEAYLERARKVLLELDDAAELARSAKADVEGVVRVMAPPAFAVHQLARRLPEFYERHPKACVELTIQDHVHAVDDAHDVTVIVKGTAEVVGDFIARPIARSELVLCATPAYFARAGMPMHPSALEGHQLLLPPVPATRAELPLYSRAGPEAGAIGEPVLVRARTPRLASMHLDTVHAAVSVGVGLGALPSFVVGEALKSGQLVRALPDWYLLSMSVYAGIPERHHVPARARAFMDFLVDTFEASPGVDPWLASGAGEARVPAAQEGRRGFGLSRTPS